jgi:hypothetical protein
LYSHQQSRKREIEMAKTKTSLVVLASAILLQASYLATAVASADADNSVGFLCSRSDSTTMQDSIVPSCFSLAVYRSLAPEILLLRPWLLHFIMAIFFWCKHPFNYSLFNPLRLFSLLPFVRRSCRQHLAGTSVAQNTVFSDRHSLAS